ncbi:hypothetical protein HN51_059196 [Arachis hypogaea]|nr:AMSH-like ubiquitin thioesterase [Arachis hypogaea]
MNSVLSLDDGRWSHPVVTESKEDSFHFFKQPLPPPVLAQVYPESSPIPPSKVADPRPGPAKSSQDSGPGPSTYQHLHIVINYYEFTLLCVATCKMMEDFLRLACENTWKNLETCDVLAGSLCSTLNEEEIFEVQDSLSLFPLGCWIHVSSIILDCHLFILSSDGGLNHQCFP